MTNIYKVILLTILFFYSTLAAENKALKMIIEQVPMIKKINAKVTHVETHKGLYQFKAQVMGPRPGILEGFITKDLKNIVVGQGFDAQTGAQLTIPYDIDLKTLKDVAAYTLGDGENEYFLFTDPECPYCQKLEHKLTSIKENVTLYVILYPLNFHKNAKSMCRYILSQEDNDARARAMAEIASHNTSYSKAKYSKIENNMLNKKIQKSLNVVKKIGISGTPAILNAKGLQVPDTAVRK